MNIEKLKKHFVENLEDFTYFHFGELVEKPNQCGCIKRNKYWYTYEIDEKNYCTFCGPFDEHGIVCAIEMLLPVATNSEKMEFTEEEIYIYIHNHFHSFIEIDANFNQAMN